MSDDFSHQPVLLREAVEALAIKPAGFYVDGTFGRGGHSRLILEHLNEQGRLLAFDKDPQAIAEGMTLQQLDPRFSIIQASFAELESVARQQGWCGEIDGLLLDLGVSSPQLDDPTRGFSFQAQGPLDMRMDPTTGVPVSEWLQQASTEQIADVLWQYGEERYSRRIARAIVAALPLATTAELAEVVKAANPAWEKHKHPATRAFQALRIFINNELEDLHQVLAASVECLKSDGRLAVITFHSLEDRIVKQFLQRQQQGPQLPRELPVQASDFTPRMRRLGKPVLPSEDELANNPRARSAKLRIGEKL